LRGGAVRNSHRGEKKADVLFGKERDRSNQERKERTKKQKKKKLLKGTDANKKGILKEKKGKRRETPERGECTSVLQGGKGVSGGKQND